MNKDGMITEWNDVQCSAQALADLFHVRRETISRLASMEGMPKAKKGVYSVYDCVQWFIFREKEARKGNTTEDKKARIAVSKQQELRYKIENSEKLKELLPTDLVQSAINQMASTLANQLDGLAPRMAAELAHIDDPALVQRKLFDECRNIRNAAAAAFEVIASDIDSSDDIEATPESGRGGVGGREPDTASEQSGAGEVANQ